MLMNPLVKVKKGQPNQKTYRGIFLDISWIYPPPRMPVTISIVYIHMYVCMYVCIYVCMYVCTYVEIWFIYTYSLEEIQPTTCFIMKTYEKIEQFSISTGSPNFWIRSTINLWNLWYETGGFKLWCFHDQKQWFRNHQPSTYKWNPYSMKDLFLKHQQLVRGFNPSQKYS